MGINEQFLAEKPRVPQDGVAGAAASTTGQLIDVQVFTATGTWTKPADTGSVEVIVTGGGGGGGGSSTTQSNCTGGCGSAGGSSTEHITSGLGVTETVTVGAAGAAGTDTGDGGAGGTSSFGAFCSATGGGGGSATLGNPPATSGIGSGGDNNIPGGEGSAPSPDDTNTAYPCGIGGASIWGSGGGCDQSTAGRVGRAFGSGGGGGTRDAGAAQIGGAGKIGIVTVKSYT